MLKVGISKSLFLSDRNWPGAFLEYASFFRFPNTFYETSSPWNNVRNYQEFVNFVIENKYKFIHLLISTYLTFFIFTWRKWIEEYNTHRLYVEKSWFYSVWYTPRHPNNCFFSVCEFYISSQYKQRKYLCGVEIFILLHAKFCNWVA